MENEKTVLAFSADEVQNLTAASVSKAHGCRYVRVAPEEYAEPMASLCGKEEKMGNVYEGEAFPEAMFFFAGLSDTELNEFLYDYKRRGAVLPTLLACLTETNADWIPLELYQTLYRERKEYREKMEKIEGEHHHDHDHFGHRE